MREAMTTALDVLGLLLVAAGLAGFLWTWLGPASLAPAGFLILGVSHFASRPERTTTTRSERVHW